MSFNYNIIAKIYLSKGKKIIRTDYTDSFNQKIKFIDWKTVIVLNDNKEELNISAFIKLPKEKIFTGEKIYTVNIHIPILKEYPNLVNVGQKFKIRENGIIGEGEILEIIDDNQPNQ